VFTGGELPVLVVEKAGVAGIIERATEAWGAWVIALSGFAGSGEMFKLSEMVKARGQALRIGYIGDWDPSGVVIDRAILSSLREDHGLDVELTRLAVTEEQIETLNLPMRPTKKKGNTHAKKFKGDSVELDAVSPVVLAALCTDFLSGFLNPDSLLRLRKAEERKRKAIIARIEK
jgi:hypothetical protein